MDRHDRADPAARRILADYRAAERMPPAAREAAWLRLQAAVHGTTSGPASDPIHGTTPDLASEPDPDPAPSLAATRRIRRKRLMLLGLAAALAVVFAGLGRLLGPPSLPGRGNQAAHDLRDGAPTPAPPARGPLGFIDVHAPDPQPLDARSTSQTLDPRPLDSQPIEPQPPDSRSLGSWSVDPWSVDAQPPWPRSRDSRPTDPQSPDSQSDDWLSTASRPTDSPHTDPRSADSHSAEWPSTASQAPSSVAPPPAKRRHRRPPGSDRAAPGLDAELSLLRRARAALTGSPQQALRLLGEHARRFPTGVLAEERMLLRVQALCAVGRPERARAAAREFARAHPDSPHAPTVTAACHE